MKTLSIGRILLLSGMVSTFALIPQSAYAKPSIHIELPGISIGLNDRHYSNGYNNRNPRYNTYRNYRYVPNRNSYRYQEQYYYQPSRRVYTPSYQSQICPEPGYSPNYYQGHGCRQHYDHYHCE